MLEKLTSYLSDFIILSGVITIVYCTYEELVKLLARKHVKPAFKPHLKPQNKPVIRLTRTAEKTPLKQTFTVELKDSRVVHELTKSNFKDLLDEFFIATEYLLELWIQHKFNLIITDDLNMHYGKDKNIEGFIRNKAIPDIYIKIKTTKHHRCGILLHEISHHLANKEAKQKNIRTTSHGPLFKKHLRKLFAPLLEDRTYYKKNDELRYHLSNGATRFSPTKDMCV